MQNNCFIAHVFLSNEGALTKNFCHALQILAIKGVGGLSESVKRENLRQKSFLQIILNEVLRICEK